MGKDQLYAFLAHLEDAFLVFLLPLHTTSERRRQMNPRKCYAIDHGLVRACVPVGSHDTGHHLENLVYLELRRRGEVLGYHLTGSGGEVDFVAADALGRQQLVQACADLGDPATRERELRALVEAVAETGIQQATVVSSSEEDRAAPRRHRGTHRAGLAMAGSVRCDSVVSRSCTEGRRHHSRVAGREPSMSSTASGRGRRVTAT